MIKTLLIQHPYSFNSRFFTGLLCHFFFRAEENWFRVAKLAENRTTDHASPRKLNHKGDEDEDDDEERTAKSDHAPVYLVLPPNRLSSYAHTLSQWNPSYFKGTHASTHSLFPLPEIGVRECACYILPERKKSTVKYTLMNVCALLHLS